jgi:hypothetical protein
MGAPIQGHSGNAEMDFHQGGLSPDHGVFKPKRSWGDFPFQQG